MDSDYRQGGDPSRNRGGWYFIKGIPVATIATLLITLIPQTIAVVMYLKSLEQKVELNAFVQNQHGKKLEVLEEKVDQVRETVAGGAVPSALNSRRIEELERTVNMLVTTEAQLGAKVNDNERRISAVERRIPGK